MIRQDIEKLILQDEAVHRIIETHISIAVLTGKHVYKIKKPVQFSFVDFGSLEKRAFYCHEEIRLNRRLCPNIYLQVVPIRKCGTDFFVGGDKGNIVEFAVKMVRLPAEREMDILLAKGEVTDDHMVQLALQLANFHRNAAVVDKGFEISRMHNDFHDILHPARNAGKVDRRILESIKISDIFLKKYHQQFCSRASLGMVRDCHGDLHTGNIFLCETPFIFDCIEFNPLLRHLDVLDELAFLCMDLESRGAEQLATRFLNQYRSEFPKAFHGRSIDAIWLYYKLYRANVRTKVCLIRQEQLGGDDRNKISMYLKMMYRYALQIERDFI